MQEFEIEFVPSEVIEVDMSNKAVEIKPPLINLVVDPTKDKQVFNHEESYGYDEVIVNAISGDTLEITPSKEEQTFNGVYTEVKSKGVTSEVDENITPNNIKSGVSILGVEGTLEAIDYWSTEPSTDSELNLKYYLKEIPKNIDVSNKTRLTNFFGNSKSLEIADLSNWNTENCTSFNSLFNGCSNLKTVKANDLNTSKITDIGQIFGGNSELEEIDLSNWDTSNLEKINAMFYMCKKLKRIDLKSWVAPKLTTMNQAFFYCSSLEYLDIRNFNFDNVTNSTMAFMGLPKNCLIIVKGDTEKAWVKAKESSLTNIKTVAELEG